MTWRKFWYGVWWVITLPFRIIWFVLKVIGRFFGEILEVIFD